MFKTGSDLIRIKNFKDPIIKISSNDFPATASIKDSFHFDQSIFFKIINFSLNNIEIRTITQSDSQPFSNDSVLNIDIYLPMVGTFTSTVRVASVVNDYGYFYLNCFFTKRSADLRSGIYKYLLLTNPSCSRHFLKSLGFRASTSEPAIFSYAEDKDLSELASLRHLAYGQNNPYVAKLSLNDLLDEFDLSAKHLVYRCNNKIIASVRGIINNGENEKSEVYKKFKESLDIDIWSDSFIEFSNFCITPEYQKTDLSTRLLNQSFLLAFKTNHKFVIITSRDELYNYYIKMGFTSIGRAVHHVSHGIRVIPMRALVSDLINNEFSKPLKEYLSHH